MATTRRDIASIRARDTAHLLCGSLILLAIVGAFIGVLAVPVYLTALFIEELGGPTWLTVATSFALGSAELCGLVLIPSYLDRVSSD